MKIIGTSITPDKKVEITLCKCKGDASHCKPNQREHRTFKSAETLERWKKSFHIKDKKGFVQNP